MQTNETAKQSHSIIIISLLIVVYLVVIVIIAIILSIVEIIIVNIVTVVVVKSSASSPTSSSSSSLSSYFHDSMSLFDSCVHIDIWRMEQSSRTNENYKTEKSKLDMALDFRFVYIFISLQWAENIEHYYPYLCHQSTQRSMNNLSPETLWKQRRLEDVLSGRDVTTISQLEFSHHDKHLFRLPVASWLYLLRKVCPQYILLDPNLMQFWNKFSSFLFSTLHYTNLPFSSKTHSTESVSNNE